GSKLFQPDTSSWSYCVTYCGRLSSQRTSCQPCAGCPRFGERQPPWELDSIPNGEDWLERPERTKSHAALCLLRSKTTRPFEAGKVGLFECSRGTNTTSRVVLPWPSTWSLRRHTPAPPPREFRHRFA